MRHLAGGVLLALAVTTGAGACGGAQFGNASEDLEHEVRGYMEGYRWRRYEDAAARLPPARREAFLDQAEKLEDDLRIDDYEIQRLKLDKEKKLAKVQVKYTWHLDSAGVVHETVSEQGWKRVEKFWLLENERHVRGEEMPGVAQVEEAATPEPTDMPGPDGGMSSNRKGL